MFDRLIAEQYCRRCGSPLEGSESRQSSLALWSCPRCRRAALREQRIEAVGEDEILAWLDEPQEHD